ncbi:hypothetical protein C8Q76DRAFT_231118 [Earliella scabrosa]|nr:hypothetical protein C8Q76DRAFT_231118 [Earliella scabrosa]
MLCHLQSATRSPIGSADIRRSRLLRMPSRPCARHSAGVGPSAWTATPVTHGRAQLLGKVGSSGLMSRPCIRSRNNAECNALLYRVLLTLADLASFPRARMYRDNSSARRTQTRWPFCTIRLTTSRAGGVPGLSRSHEELHRVLSGRSGRSSQTQSRPPAQTTAASALRDGHAMDLLRHPVRPNPTFMHTHDYCPACQQLPRVQLTSRTRPARTNGALRGSGSNFALTYYVLGVPD